MPDPESIGRRRTASLGAPWPRSRIRHRWTRRSVPGGAPRRNQTPATRLRRTDTRDVGTVPRSSASARRHARRRWRPLPLDRWLRAAAPIGPRDFVPSRREGPTRRPDSRRFSAQSRSTAPSIVPPKPEMVRKPGLRVCIHLPTSPFGTVPISRMPTTLATHALPQATPADRGAARRASVAGARERIRQARPSVADRRP